MAIQYAPNISNTSAIGTGLGQGIQELAGRKISQLQERERKAELSSLLENEGYSPNLAKLLSSLPEKDFLSGLQSVQPQGASQQAQQQPQQLPQAEDIVSLQKRLEQLQAGRPESITGGNLQQLSQAQKLKELGLDKQAEAPFDLSKVNARDLLAQAAAQGLNLSPEQQQKIESKLGAIQADKDKFAALQNDINAYVQRQQGTQRPTIEAIAEPIEKRPLFKKPLTEAEKIAGRKADISEKNVALKETKKFRDDVNAGRRNAEEKLHDLKRLDELENEKLESAGYYELLKRSGFDIPALMNPSSQEYDKISTNFIRDAGNVFKGKVSNYEADLFLKLIPSLSMSPEGRNRVRANFERVERTKLAEGKVMNDMIKRNGGVPPIDLEDQVYEKMQPFRDKISEQFKKDLNRPVPKAEGKLATAFQAGLGEAIGLAKAAIPGAVKSVGKGIAQGIGQGLIG